MRRRQSKQTLLPPDPSSQAPSFASTSNSEGEGNDARTSKTTGTSRPLPRSPTVDLSDTFLNEKRPLRSKKRFAFLFGGLLGAFAAGIFFHGSGEFKMSDFEDHLSSISLDWMSVPDLSKYMELGDFSQTFSNFTESFKTQRPWKQGNNFGVGQRLAKAGVTKKHAVIMVPGIISSGLESWSTDVPSAAFFRQRIWGTTSMVRAVMRDKDAWIRSMSLDPETGLDPPGAKLRAAQGFDAASYFVQGYFLWAKIIENLAAIGYDENDMALAPYDWRLSFYNLQTRDAYFSRLKMRIEHDFHVWGKKTVLVSHSMGGQLMLFFLKWVEAKGYGDGGSDWVEKHIESFINVGGTLLGVPKASAALLSGEMRDTVELPAAGVFLLEKFFSRAERAQLFRTWAGASSMYLKGGSAVWGDASGAPDDPENSTLTGGHIYYFRKPNTSELNAETVYPNLTMDAAYTYLLQNAPDSYARMMETNYSHGIERDPEQLEKNDLDHRKWSNPLETRLPNAPSMKLYCVYGYGKPTERAYFYQEGGYEHDESQGSDYEDAQCQSGSGNCATSERNPLHFPVSRNAWIDSSVTLEHEVPSVKSGVVNGEGDGTVVLLSLGSMCVEGWKKKRYNPAGIKVVTHELKHRPLARDIRGGPATADHVDILGNEELMEGILRVAAGIEDPIAEKVESRIREMSAKIKWDSE